MPVSVPADAGRWVADPLALAVLGVTAALLHLRRRGRRPGWDGRDSALVAGACVVALVLVSPLAVAAGDLVAAHMVQHLVLVLVAAPLLAAGDPGPAVLAALPDHARRRIVDAWRGLPTWARGPGTGVATAAALHAAVLWLWHLPVLYDAAVRVAGVHLVEHLSLVATAVVFWGAVARRRGRPRGLLVPTVVASAGLVVQGGVLAAILTFAPEPLYAVHSGGAAWGLGPVEDQRLAGSLLWVVGGPAYAVAAVRAVLRGLGPAWEPRADRPQGPSRLRGTAEAASYDGRRDEQR